MKKSNAPAKKGAAKKAGKPQKAPATKATKKKKAAAPAKPVKTAATKNVKGKVATKAAKTATVKVSTSKAPANKEVAAKKPATKPAAEKKAAKKAAKPSEATKPAKAVKTTKVKKTAPALKTAAKAAKADKPVKAEKAPKATKVSKGASPKADTKGAAPAAKDASAEIEDSFKRPAKPFFTEVKPGMERVIKRGDKTAASPVIDLQARRKGPATEETPEELAERIERELQSQSFLKRNRMRPQMCTKCGINAVSPRFTIDRELAYCEICAEILHLGETKEARRMEYNLSVKKEEGENNASENGEEDSVPEEVD